MMVCRSLELFTKKSSFISFSLLRELDRSNLMNFVHMEKLLFLSFFKIDYTT